MLCTTLPASMAAATIASKSWLSVGRLLDMCDPRRRVYTQSAGWRGGRAVSAIFSGNVLIPGPLEGPEAWGAPAPTSHHERRSARPNALDLDLQFHFLLEPIFVAEVDTEVGAVERRRGVSAAHFLLRHRVDH